MAASLRCMSRRWRGASWKNGYQIYLLEVQSSFSPDARVHTLFARGQPTHNRLFKVASASTSVKHHDIEQAHYQVQTEKPLKAFRKRKASLVIFDKDGTMICFHAMWGPWARIVAKKIEEGSGLKIADKVYEVFGYCNQKNIVEPGVLAEGTSAMVKQRLQNLLVSEGIDKERAVQIVKDSYVEADHTSKESLRPLDDLHTLFRVLKEHDMKIAICTSDSRYGTLQSLESLGLLSQIDRLVCGDDIDNIPKPAQYNANMICSELNVDPSEAIMVGDSLADVGMGRLANLGGSIGVSTGVTPREELEPHADVVVDRLMDIVPLILPAEVHKNYSLVAEDGQVRYPPQTGADQRGAVKPRRSVAIRPGKKATLVIFDKDGSLVYFNSYWPEWIKKLKQRLEVNSGLNLGDKVYSMLGFSTESGKFGPGLWAEATHSEMCHRLEDILCDQGMYRYRAKQVIEQSYNECSDSSHYESAKPVGNLVAMFKTLKEYGVKIAICTSNPRDVTLNIFKELGIMPYVDTMVCGDDRDGLFKPSPDAVRKICECLDVDPSETFVVGDTMSDIGMGKMANVAKTVGVLTGVSSAEDLESHADHVVPSIREVLGLLLPEDHRQILEQHEAELDQSEVKDSSSVKGSGKVGITNQQKRGFLTSSGNPVSSSQRQYSTSVSSGADTYDYVIVGAGSAGCVLANRLSADPNNRVLVLEAGPEDKWWNWKIHMPAALMYNLCDDKYNWYYHTVPQKHMNDRVMYWPRGRVWGGSSALNAMVYIRGHAYDYDRWEKEGAAGWSYADCLPYFRKAQTHDDCGADEYRGGDGPLHVSHGKTNNPLFKAFVDAALQAGYPYTPDMNGYQQEGFGPMDMTIHNGKRWSASQGYLRPALDRSNLSVQSLAMTHRVLFQGNRAVGVEYKQKRGAELKHVRAEKEVILSGGAINSPQLLMLSGVGDADDLKKLDIPVVQHLPGVGQNLQDHLEVYFQQECTQPITLYSAQWKFPHNMIRIGLQWFLTQKGWGASAHLETGGFIRTRPGLEHPNIQFHFLPSTVNDHGRKMGDRHAFQCHMGTMRSPSRGYLKLKSANPYDHPILDPNYMSTEEDWVDFRAAVRLTREIFAQKAFDEFRGPELLPGSQVTTDEQIDTYIKNYGDSAYHPSCTCKMGAEDDKMAVVNNKAQVFGIKNLRVVDASIMPSVVSGNLNAPTIMTAEKCADIILGNPPLPRSTAKVWRPKSLDTQRTTEGVDD